MFGWNRIFIWNAFKLERQVGLYTLHIIKMEHVIKRRMCFIQYLLHVFRTLNHNSVM